MGAGSHCRLEDVGLELIRSAISGSISEELIGRRLLVDKGEEIAVIWP